MILITGATGNVGKEVLNLCRKHEVPCIAAGRSPGRRSGDGVEYRYLDFENPDSFSAAQGVSQVFLVRPPQIADIKKTIGPFLDACRGFGVRKVVFLSLLGADRIPVVPHHAVEKKVKSLGLQHTFLRAGFFMQNLVTTHADEIRRRDELVAPGGKGKTTFVHARDIAEVGFKALRDEITADAVDVAGEDTLTYREVADKLSEVLGRKITYKSPSPPGFALYRIRNGTPLKFALVMTGIYLPTRFGAAEYKGATRIRDLLGRPPVSFDTFLREEKSVWSR